MGPEQPDRIRNPELPGSFRAKHSYGEYNHFTP